MHDKDVIQKVEKYKESLLTIEKRLSEYEENIIDITKEIESIDINSLIVKDTKKEMYKIEEEIAKEKIYVKVFGKTGLSSFFLKEKIKHMETTINFLCGPFLRAGNQQKVRFYIDSATSNIEFGWDLSGNKKNNSVSSFTSGMEHFILNLSMKLTLASVANIATSNLFLIDEKLSVLDQDRLANIESFFHFLKSTSLSNLLLISHIESIRDFVDYTLQVEKSSETNYSCLCMR